MKKYNLIYYFLFMAVIMGAFASMAQNSYGMKLMGAACFGFFLVFLQELLFSVKSYVTLSKQEKTWLSVELSGLSLLSLLFCFRSFLVEIPFGKEGILAALLALGIVTVVNGLSHIRKTGNEDKTSGVGLAFYFGALLAFIITFFIAIVKPSAAIALAPLGFILLLCLAGLAFFYRKRVVEGASMIWLILTMRNKAGILMIAFGLMFIYFGLNRAAIFPPLYSGDVPTGYLELIQRAESGSETVNGKKRYELFDEQYSRFVRRHGK